MNVRAFAAVLALTGLPLLHAIGQSGWTVERCIAVAKEHNLTLQSARNSARASDLSRQELGTTQYPQMKLGALALYAPAANSFGYDPAISNGGELAGQIFVQQSVYDGGIRTLRTEQLETEMEQRRTDIRRSERDLVYTVRQGYIEVLRAQAESALERDGVRQLEEYLDLVKQLMQGGTASSTDVLKTEVQLANARIGLQRAEESAAIDLFSLKEVMGLPPDTAIVLEGTLEESLPVDADTLGAALSHAPASNLDLSRSEMEVAKSIIDIELARHELYPAVSLIADAGVLTSGDNLRLPEGAREPIFGFSVGVSVELPLLTWGATDLRVQQRQIAADNFRLEHDQLRRSIDAQTRMLRLQLANALQRLHASRTVIDKAEGNYLLTKSKYATGTALSLEVLNAQQLLVDSRLAEVQATADVSAIRSRIEQFLTQ
jgi:outer membrane protein